MIQGTPPTGAGPFGRRIKSGRWILIGSSALLAVVLVASLLTGFLTNAARSTMLSDKAKLDQALQDARVNQSVPESLLAPIVKQEQSVTGGDDGTIFGYQRASSAYVKLTQQTLAIEQMSPAQARALAQTDLNTLSGGVSKIVKGNYIEAAGFQSRLTQAQTSFSSAATTHDYFVVDAAVQDQIGAVNLFQPTLDKLNTFTDLATSMSALVNGPSVTVGPTPLQCAVGMDGQYWQDDPLITLPASTTSSGTALQETQQATADLAAFRTATTTQDFTNLSTLLVSQTQQAQAHELNLLPTVTTNLLTTFQSDITTAKAQGVSVTTANQQYTTDSQQAQALAAKPDVAAYTKLLTNIRAHLNGLQLPVLKAKAAADVKTLKALVAKGQALKTRDVSNGVYYPDAYEYADPNTGVGDATTRLKYAQTLQDYQAIDSELQSFIHNITAMITNREARPTTYTKIKAWSNQVHATDLQLMQYYQVTPYRVVVVSLREQAARFYDNGKFVRMLPVTTGAPDLPSIPGMHCVLDKQTNTVFKSPDPPGSPNYYQPTPIHYAMYYSYYGYELHDAWWRQEFGVTSSWVNGIAPGQFTNLPHYDPAAFNGGSHGCINFNYAGGSSSDSAWLYNFVSIGTPVIVY
ncbi:MAG TPA: L,D-transpeptidase [Ktedonobacterales bacterium]